jgi:Mce-associated membrane protein
MADDADTAGTAVEESGTPAAGENLDRAEAGKARSAGPRGVWLSLVAGLLIVAPLAAVGGWLGLQVRQSQQRTEQREEFLQAARQGALNLTTISYSEVDADIKRILDSATGAFFDDFQKRSGPFVQVVKQAQSKSQGTITAAGLESVQGDSAQALVAVAVTTSNSGAAEQQPRAWRMRISVQKVDGTAKVSNVEFVP